RQRDDADHGAREQVGTERLAVVTTRERPPERDGERQSIGQRQDLPRLAATGHPEHVHVCSREVTRRRFRRGGTAPLASGASPGTPPDRDSPPPASPTPSRSVVSTSRRTRRPREGPGR